MYRRHARKHEYLRNYELRGRPLIIWGVWCKTKKNLSEVCLNKKSFNPRSTNDPLILFFLLLPFLEAHWTFFSATFQTIFLFRFAPCPPIWLMVDPVQTCTRILIESHHTNTNCWENSLCWKPDKYVRKSKPDIDVIFVIHTFVG